jgi:pyruvate-formate lyase-activating enzyme
MCFEFLSYHEYGRDKWKACGLEYTMKDAFVPEETVKAFRQGFTEKGLRVIRT